MTAAAHPLWSGDRPLVLASASLARRRLLEAAGIPVAVDPAAIDERAVEERLAAHDRAPAMLAGMLAAQKALAVSARRPGELVLGADQTLVCADLPLHKPADRAGALQQLLWLAGREHGLHSAAALVRDGAVLWQETGEARLRMRALDAAAIGRYLDAAGPDALASVGAYRIEGPGIHLFDRVEGEHAVILGLPLLALLAALRAQGLLAC